MADRVLVWHHEGTVGGQESRIGPTYYLDADYEAVALRIHAETAPSLHDAQFDILADGVSIFTNRTPALSTAAGRLQTVTNTVSALLIKGDMVEEDAEDFSSGLVLTRGMWLYCKPKAAGGGGKNFTIALELRKVGEEDEITE